MNPEQKLEELIVKYRIDSCIEEFQQFLKAKELLHTLTEGAERIALVAEDLGDAAEVKSLIGPGHAVSRYRFKDLDKKETLIEADLMICLPVNMSEEHWEKVNANVRSKGIRTVGLYDYFRQHGLALNREFYDVLQGKRMGTRGEQSDIFFHTDYYEAVYRMKKKYKEAVEQKQKEVYLRQLIFTYIYIKDFIYAKHYIEEYVRHQYTDCESYRQFQEEVEALLAKVKKITVAKKEQIYMFWVDALGKGEEKGMTYFEGLKEDSLDFDNAFTVAPITSLTMKAIFLKKHFYEDKSYKLERIAERDSSLLQYLKKEGYVFQYFGFEERFEEKLYGKHQMFKAPSSMVYWSVLCDLCTSAQKKFYLIHGITETHVPFRSGVIEDFYYDAEEPAANDREKQERHLQREEAKQYFDKQFAFYRSFINDENLQIVMSDHVGEEGFSSRGKGTNVNCFVRGKGVRKGKIDKFFSYINFEDLVKYLLSNEEAVLERVLADYVCYEYPDTYSRSFVSARLKDKRLRLEDFGWKGCSTLEDEYVVYTTGEEKYFRYPSWLNRVALPECAERVDTLRKLTGEIFTEVLEDDYFQYSRLLHRVWDNYKRRTGGMEPGVRCLRECLEAIPQDKIIAVRGGGQHTVGLLTALGQAAVRIRYIVDRDKESCRRLVGREGLCTEIITPEEMAERKIDTVLLSSLVYRKEMKEELNKTEQNYEVIDVYELLEAQGILPDRAFYVNRVLPEDYEGVTVGGQL